MFLSRLILCALFSATAIPARTIPAVCGSSPVTHLEVAAFHKQALRQKIAKAKTSSANAAPALSRDSGELVIMDDSGGVVAQRKAFNLTGSKLVFTPDSPTAKSYGFTTAAGDFSERDSTDATPLTGLDDDDSIAITLPFAFPFFGARYNNLFVNSDGNVTFNTGDSASSDRSLGRLVAGPPRIALIFGDLDPSRVPDSVRVRKMSDAVVITWQGVPEYSSDGRGELQTAQLRLFPSGKIEMVWQAVAMSELIVGIAPGNLQGAASLVDFAVDITSQYSAAVAERFGTSDAIDLLTAAQRFYQSHEDSYDFLAFYNTAGISPGAGIIAFASPVRDVALGIGAPAVGNIGGQYGSTNRLKAVLNLGPLTQYPSDPNARLPARFGAGDTPLTVLAHEAGHLFLAYASIRDPQNGTQPMLGRDLFHWSFFFNSEASLLEGNRIQDNGPSSSPRFVTTATVESYSPLDQYLMGLRAPELVPPTFVVLNANLPLIGGAGAAPSVGARFNGTRRDVTIGDIIAVEGGRLPDHTITQRRFRFALVLITPSGALPAAATLAQVENLRRQFEPAFVKYTGGRAVAETTLARNLRLTVEPYAGVVLGDAITAAVELDAPSAQALSVKLSMAFGIVEAPANVVIAAGTRRVEFTVRGLLTGVELLTATAGAGYITSEARIAVSASSKLRLSVVDGDEQAAKEGGGELETPIVVRLTDAAGAPYPGQMVRAQPSLGGLVTPPEVQTNRDGEAAFRWTTATATGNELLMSLSSAPAVTARVVALGKPAFRAAGIVNAASFEVGLTPGGIATIFGSNLERSKVTINQLPATMLYTSANQLNFVTPQSANGSASVIVANRIASSTVEANLVAVQPGIFFDAGSGYGAVIDRGMRIFEVYGTGFGDGTAVVSAQIGNQPAQVLFSGAAPGFAGLHQVNVKANVPPGEYLLQLTAAGRLSNAVKIRVSE